MARKSGSCVTNRIISCWLVSKFFLLQNMEDNDREKHSQAQGVYENLRQLYKKLLDCKKNNIRTGGNRLEVRGNAELHKDA